MKNRQIGSESMGTGKVPDNKDLGYKNQHTGFVLKTSAVVLGRVLFSRSARAGGSGLFT